MSNTKGQTAIVIIVIVMSIALVIVSSMSALVVKEAKVGGFSIRSRSALYASEAGVEDAVYRVMRGKQIGSSETFSIGNTITTTTITDTVSESIIYSEGVLVDIHRSTEVGLNKIFDAGSFNYGVQVGAGGISMANNSAVSGNVYSNGSIIGASGAAITGDVIVASGLSATPIVEWISNDADHAFATVSSNSDIAQSFTATASGPLNRVSVLLAKAGSPLSNITVRIASDNGGSPSTSGLASATIAPSQVGAGASWINAAFASTATVANGTKYWIVLDYGSNSGTNYWIWRKDSSDAYADNTGKYKDNWTSGGSWTNALGDLAFKVWIGGTNTRIETVDIGNAATGTGRANLFVNTTIHGSSCPNPYCIIEDPETQGMPIAQTTIDEWKNDAAAGGVCGLVDGCDASGDYRLTNNASGSLGPKKITGNLELDNGATLTVNGTLWVAGNIVLSNNCNVALNPSYGNMSGVIITDGTVVISNNCAFAGSGDPDSYVMLLSEKNAPSDNVIMVDNNAAGVIYYVDSGRIQFSNNATAKEATAYGITLDNNAVITYETGLADLRFSAGPSGGGYEIGDWREVP